MKARIKETGEVLIVEEVSDKHVYVKMPCGISMSVALRKEEVEILQDGCNVIDWEQRKYEIAKDVMTGFVIESTFWSAEQMADESVRYADALIDRLKGGIERSWPNRAGTCDECAVFVSTFESIIKMCDKMKEYNRENLTATIKCNCSDAIEYYHKWVDKKGSNDKESND